MQRLRPRYPRMKKQQSGSHHRAGSKGNGYRETAMGLRHERIGWSLSCPGVESVLCSGHGGDCTHNDDCAHVKQFLN